MSDKENICISCGKPESKHYYKEEVLIDEYNQDHYPWTNIGEVITESMGYTPCIEQITDTVAFHEFDDHLK